jgi:hypothetical protein
LDSSSNVSKAIKSRRMRLAGHVARMGQMRKVYNILGDVGIDGKIILNWILEK